MAALWPTASPDRIDVRLRGVAVPVTVVRGTRDRLCDPDWARRVAAAAPAGCLVELPGAAHLTVQTHPAMVAQLVADAAGASRIAGEAAFRLGNDELGA
jgi:pimeloyl-ACP methyl ester carboxylesterase